MEWLFGLLSSLFGWIVDLFAGEQTPEGEREGGLISGTVDAVSSVGSSVGDFFRSSDNTLLEKAMLAGGIAYLVAPDATTKVVSNAAEGISDTFGSVMGSAAAGVGSFLSSYWPWLLGALGLYLVFSDDD